MIENKLLLQKLLMQLLVGLDDVIITSSGDSSRLFIYLLSFHESEKELEIKSLLKFYFFVFMAIAIFPVQNIFV